MSWHRYNINLNPSIWERLTMSWRLLTGWSFSFSVNIHVDEGARFMMDRAELTMERDA